MHDATRFRFLNNPGANVGPQQFSVAENPERTAQDVQQALSIMRSARPGGCTPLTSHILEIHQEISRMAPELRRTGKRVVLVIATDGLPTDERGYAGPEYSQEFVDALRLLEGLPIWMVIRLCTDEEQVVSFYNDLDSQLELSLEVLDDFSGEAQEVIGENPWVNYALPLHRLREMGYHDRVFDLLDERLLTKTEVRDFCELLFGEQSFDGVADPSLDWSAFLDDIQRMLRSETSQWVSETRMSLLLVYKYAFTRLGSHMLQDPVKRKLRAWIDTRKLNSIYGPNSCIIL